MHELSRRVERWARETPRAVAMDAAGEPVTVVGWQERARACEGALRSLGVRAGHRVALTMEQTPRALAALLALDTIGAEVLLLRPQQTERETESVLATFDADFVGEPWASRRRHSGNRDAVGPTGAFALMTSGVTGRPKVVRRSWERALKNAEAFARRAGYLETDRVLCTTPLHHSFAFSTALLAGVVARATLVLTAPGALATRAVSHADGLGASVIQSVPFVYRSLLSARMRVPTTARLYISAGEAVGRPLVEAWRAASGRGLSNHYGTTEAGMVTLAEEADADSLGRVLDGLEVRAVAATSQTERELLVRVHGRSPHETDPGPESHDGWIPTGDLGYLSDDGRVFLTGRKTSRLNVAGNKVDPVEVEDAVRSFPGVVDCAAMGRAHDDCERIEVILVASGAIDEVELRRHLVARLSGYKIPRAFHVVADLPRSPSGKLLRGALPDMLREPPAITAMTE